MVINITVSKREGEFEASSDYPRVCGVSENRETAIAGARGACFATLAYWEHPPTEVAFNVVEPEPACVTPNGRTDGHGAYIEMVNGVTVCAFCKTPSADGPRPVEETSAETAACAPLWCRKCGHASLRYVPDRLGMLLCAECASADGPRTGEG